MLKKLLSMGSFACVLSLTSISRAQALPAATGHGGLQVGLGVTRASPDYGQQPIKGVSAYVDRDFTPHFGIEAAVHYVAFITPTDLAEDTYVVGPRFLITRRRFTGYAKAVAGLGDLVIQETQDNQGRYSGKYFMYAIGAGIDIQATQHLIIRPLDFEAQKWPNLGNGLSPYVVTVGAAWRFR